MAGDPVNRAPRPAFEFEEGAGTLHRVRWPWGLLVCAVAAGCLESRPYNALGYRCDTNADCDKATLCVDNKCLAPGAAERPGPENTGVPPGTVLTPSVGFDITVDGTVIDGLDVTGCIRVLANNVTIRRTRLRCNWYVTVEFAKDKTGLLVEDSELENKPLGGGLGIGYQNYTARRLNVHAGAQGAHIGDNVVFEHSYLHDFVGTDLAGFETRDATNVVLSRNQIDARGANSISAIVLRTYDGPLQNIQIKNNWLNGGAYVLQLLGTKERAAQLQVEGNRFGRDFTTAPYKIEVGTTFVGNVFNDNDEPLAGP